MLKREKNLILIVILFFVSLVLISAFVIEYGLSHQPCKLCIYERIPYILSILLIIKIFEIYGYDNVYVLKEKFSTKGGILSWLGILFTAGFTPLPFKIFTITSGFIHFNILFFIFTCIVARGLRFFLEALLVYKYGAAIGPFLEKKGGKWTLIITGIILLLGAGVYFYTTK